MVLFCNRAKATTVHIDPLESHVFVQMYFRIMILKTESLKADAAEFGNLFG